MHKHVATSEQGFYLPSSEQPAYAKGSRLRMGALFTRSCIVSHTFLRMYITVLLQVHVFYNVSFRGNDPI